MLPHARPDDGLLDVLAIPVASRAEALTMFMHAVAGEHLQTEGTRYVRGKHVKVTTAEPVAVQADGEAAGFTPLEVDLLEVRVPFIVP
jgi:diacylglycerol kinase family enzyme